ncbi:MAG: FAD-binding oxidoreductase [Bdellovibrionales bacterium]|nr:FAD-binding oxidoreductase [Bdellovibrionales bacterium]
MSYSYWQDQTTRSSQSFSHYDMVVIGGGISGLSAAYWLKKEDPSLKIALLEKGEIASGATGRNAGFITCGSVEHFNRLVERWGESRAKEIWMFSETNLELLKSELFAQLSSEDLGELGFEEKGSFSLASTDSEFAELKKTAELMAHQGIEVETLSSTEVEQRVGGVQFSGGIKYIRDASIHPVKLCHLLQNATPIDYFPHHEVSFIEAEGDHRRVRTNKQDFMADVVVLAGNGYLPLLDSFFADKVFPTRGQILAIEPVPSFMEGPCYANFVLDYFRQLPNGVMLIGGFRQLEKVTEVGYSDHTTDVIQQALYEFLQTHIPQLSGKKVTHRWAGIMGFSVDGQPFVGAKADDPQIFYLGGFTAHGLGLAFHSGKCLTDLMFGRTLPEFISGRRF